MLYCFFSGRILNNEMIIDQTNPDDISAKPVALEYGVRSTWRRTESFRKKLTSNFDIKRILYCIILYSIITIDVHIVYKYAIYLVYLRGRAYKQRHYQTSV